MNAIPVGVLKTARRIITHANCPDGVASAMILHDCLPDAEIVFCQYKSPELAALKPRQGDLFCDFTPPRDRVDEWLTCYPDTVVLDHHETQKDVVERFRYGVYSDVPGVSGAVLAYREVWLPLGSDSFSDRTFEIEEVVSEFANVAGLRDTWQTSSPLWQESCEQAAALTFWPRDRLLSLSLAEWPAAMKFGEVLVQRNQQRLLDLYRGAYRIQSPEVNGVVLCVECSAEISDLAELVKTKDPTVSVVVGFHFFADEWTKPRLRVSMRSNLGADISVFAAKLGGGGHKFAAGAVTDAPSWCGPYTFFESLFVGRGDTRVLGSSFERQSSPLPEDENE